MARSRFARRAPIVVIVGACVALVASLAVRRVLIASLPALDGSLTLTGLSAPVSVERDALGIPTISGASRIDVARATGFVHAQDRFFEMDVARRFAAGELSELFGAATLATDRTNRVHRLRRVARQVLAHVQPDERAVLQAYADGVNAGLAALGARPPEYLLLRSQPARWRAEDCLLVLGAMFNNDLQNARRELELQAMYDALPAPVVDFLRPLGDDWDAPILGRPIEPPPIPGPQIVNLRDPQIRANSHSVADPQIHADFRRLANICVNLRNSWTGPICGGSNAWAISGTHTADGHALVANDPHLLLQVPNIWYRLSVEWRDGTGSHRLAGVSLPGIPFVAIGSNGHVAWGFTVAFDDRSDMVIVEDDTSHPGSYRTPDGPRPFEHAIEWIKVKGRPDERFEITSTIWGPIVTRDAHGHAVAQHWQAHLPDGMDLTFAKMESAATVEQVLDIANRSGLPSYNAIVADERGSIGWTVTGRLPRRRGFDGRVPTSWADGTRRWDGWLDPGDYPRIVNPSSGRIWSSNNRPIDRPLLDRLGLEGYVTGPRARQVRDDLMAIDRMTPRDSLNIQLDDRALFLNRWRTFLLAQLGDRATGGHPQRREFRRLVERGWDGRASVSSVGYRLVARFRYELAQRVIGPMLPASLQHALRPGAISEWWESALWRLVQERPMHLLARRWNDWDGPTLAAVDATIAAETANGRPLSEAAWGWTALGIAHPLSKGVPWLARWFDMPYAPRPGDVNMPRMRMPTPIGEVSASMRMVVSPGHEETGMLHMPGGESGHPLSPHYGDMYRAWLEGRPTPFLPGPATHTLTLQPHVPG